MGPLIERRDYAKGEVQTRTAITDLCTRDSGHAAQHARRRRRTASTLGHILVHLTIFVRMVIMYMSLNWQLRDSQKMTLEFILKTVFLR